MTFEELKAEAKAQGYRLIKREKSVRFIPCTCGCNTRQHFTRWDGMESLTGLRCIRCGKEAYGTTYANARQNWNEMITKEQNMDCPWK